MKMATSPVATEEGWVAAQGDQATMKAKATGDIAAGAVRGAPRETGSTAAIETTRSQPDTTDKTPTPGRRTQRST